jgi:predicted O-methyltransferase YrrM
MKHLRPHDVFDRVKREDRSSVICLPHVHSLTSMLERAILVSLLKLIKPCTVFEFGTYLGESTLMLAANSNAKVYTIDINNHLLHELDTKLDKFEEGNVQRHLNEQALFQETEYEGRIETIIGDSNNYDFSPFYNRIDFVLIDGGHHVEVVESDTQQALAMLSPKNPACIVWHDYGNPNYEITDCLDSLSGELELFHVAETGYVFFIKNIKDNSYLRW